MHNLIKNEIEFAESSSIHVHFTRLMSNSRTIFTRTSSIQNSIKGFNLFNSLSPNFKNETDFARLKKLKKTYCFNKCVAEPVGK